MRHEIQSTSGNSYPLEDIEIVDVQPWAPALQDLTEEEEEKRLLEQWASIDGLFDFETISEYKEAAISYIAGYVTKHCRRTE